MANADARVSGIKVLQVWSLSNLDNALSFFGDIEPFLADESRARRSRRRQEGKQLRSRLCVQRCTILGDLKRLDVGDLRPSFGAVRLHDQIAIAIRERANTAAN